MHDHDYLPVNPELDTALVDVTAAISDGHGGPISGPGEAVKRTADPFMRVRLRCCSVREVTSLYFDSDFHSEITVRIRTSK